MEHTTAPTTTHDNDLDLYRGCTMIYIVCFIHILSAMGIDWYAQDLWSLLLIEMPVIFYIAGASYTLSPKKSFPRYIWGRLVRIVIPLIIYLLFVVTLYAVRHDMSIPESIALMASLSHSEITQGCVFGLSHLWFIHVYLIIAVLLPILHYATRHINRWVAYTIIIALMVWLYLQPNYVACYIASAMAGLYYHRPLPCKWWGVALLMLGALMLALCQGYSCNMQLNKFPPNLLFFAYTTLMLIMLHRPLQWLCKQLARIPFARYIINQYAHHSYTIYLYHVQFIAAACYIYSAIGTRLQAHIPFIFSPIISGTIVAIATLLSMIAIARIVDTINNAITRHITPSATK